MHRSQVQSTLYVIFQRRLVYGYEAEPSYLSFSTIAYFFGVLYQKFAPGCIKPAIYAFGKLRKDAR